MAQEYVVGCDNAAVGLKDMVCAFLKQSGFEVKDMGCYTASDPENYPSIAKKVCNAIQDSDFTKKGILICGTGIGMAISANKFKGIRAAVCHDCYSAERLALSNNGNVLCMGARVIGPELAKKILQEWVNLEYMDGPSTPKIKEIKDIEQTTMR